MNIQPEFPPHRRQDPKRQAELAVYQELEASKRAGRVLYELKTSKTAPELDFTIMLENLGIVGLQVKGGQHTVEGGQWYLATDNGPEPIPDPLKVSWDAALQIREVVKKKLGRKVFIVAALVFPDMEFDQAIHERAQSDRVHVLFGEDDLAQRLADIIGQEEIFTPPTAWVIDEISQALMPYLGEDAAVDEIPEPVTTAADREIANAAPVIHHANTANVYNGPVTIR